MSENQNDPIPPQQTGPQGQTASQQANPRGYAQYPGYQDQGGYGYPPAPGNGPPWAQQGHYQDDYHHHRHHACCCHPPMQGNGPSWAYHGHHGGGHPAYYGPPPQAQWHAPPGYGYGPHPGHHHHSSAHTAYASHHDSGLGSFFNFRDERFVKGAITGAAATFLLTNDTVQKNAIKSLVKLWSMFQGGFEEVKERFKDAEAEIKTEGQSNQ